MERELFDLMPQTRWPAPEGFPQAWRDGAAGNFGNGAGGGARGPNGSNGTEGGANLVAKVVASFMECTRWSSGKSAKASAISFPEAPKQITALAFVLRNGYNCWYLAFSFPCPPRRTTCGFGAP